MGQGGEPVRVRVEGLGVCEAGTLAAFPGRVWAGVGRAWAGVAEIEAEPERPRLDDRSAGWRCLSSTPNSLDRTDSSPCLSFSPSPQTVTHGTCKLIHPASPVRRLRRATQLTLPPPCPGPVPEQAITPRRVFYGTLIHSLTLTKLEFIRNGLLGVDEAGVIAFLEKDVEAGQVGGMLAAAGWDGVQVTVLNRGEFLIPGCVATILLRRLATRR